MSVVLFEKNERIAWITLNRPKKLNAVSRELSQALLEALERFDKDDNLWVGIITGSGEKAFSVGADLSDASHMNDPQEWEADFVRRLNEVKKPLIAAINGYCLGVGFALALTCDMRVASQDASFGTPDQKRNTVDCFASLALPTYVPRAVAMEILLTGEMIDAHEAHRVGLINRVVTPSKLIPEAQYLAEKILGNGPLALLACKELVKRGSSLSLEDGISLFKALAKPVLYSEDTVEGISSFLEKKPPVWKGR